MQNKLFKKGLFVGIIILFISSSTLIESRGLLENNIISDLRNQKRLKNFDENISSLMKLGHIPSLSACIIKNNTIQWSKAYGLANIKHNISAQNDTVYYIASVSKTFAAVALLQLYEQGLFDLDDNVSEYLPFDLKNPNYLEVNITFRMLLSHHASLHRFLIGVGFFFGIIGIPNNWLEEFLIPSGRFYFPHVWKNYSPGSEFTYSDFGFEIIEYLVERISKQSFDEYCTEHILQPLNMSNTSYHLKDFKLEKIATQYIYLFGRYIPLPYVEIESYAAGGLRSTVLDLAIYLLMHMNHGSYNGVKILENYTIEEMHSPQLGYKRYGLGWIIKNYSTYIIEGHAGVVPGAIAQMWYNRSNKIGVIYFYNQHDMIVTKKEDKILAQIDDLLWDKANNL